MKIKFVTNICTYLFQKDGIDYEATTTHTVDYAWGGGKEIITLVTRLEDHTQVEDKETIDYAEKVLLSLNESLGHSPSYR